MASGKTYSPKYDMSHNPEEPMTKPVILKMHGENWDTAGSWNIIEKVVKYPCQNFTYAFNFAHKFDITTKIYFIDIIKNTVNLDGKNEIVLNVCIPYI